jgi:hypothetical protein
MYHHSGTKNGQMKGTGYHCKPANLADNVPSVARARQVVHLMIVLLGARSVCENIVQSGPMSQ